MNQAQQLLDALVKRFIAQKAEGIALFNLYTNQSVGVGEHPQILDELEKAITKIVEAEEKIKIITNIVGKEAEDGTKQES
jgi:hypothetical protein